MKSTIYLEDEFATKVKTMYENEGYTMNGRIKALLKQDLARMERDKHEL